MFAIAFPAIDATLIEIGPLAIRWYALAYIAGIVLGWRYAIVLARSSPGSIPRAAVDDFLLWATLGIIVGGRLGYVLVYQPAWFLDHPLEAFALWQGGMSFHGGCLGVAVAAVFHARRHGTPLLALADILACVAPIGLLLGRLANFVNGELYGRATEVPWAVLFPADPGTPRHPSQLYEAALEGLVLLVIMRVAWMRPAWRKRPGMMTGIFLTGYAVFRSAAEMFREPDSHLGFVAGTMTMGQLLSLPMAAAGIALLVMTRRRA
ncbi:MAG: prolipoprotein diacylglyceryl transferase [Alphaproteobacteria bacterium]|nr:prolipoprotein diacylglyceryl transferase [Alphaproteobacteria bacterium]